MYLKSLNIKNLKLIADLTLDFTRDGEWRQWTVLIGRNGRCKTAVLQAIALAAAGDLHANHLGGPLVQSFRPRREDETADPTLVEAIFSLEPPPVRSAARRGNSPTVRERTLPDRGLQGPAPVALTSRLMLLPEADRFYTESSLDQRPNAGENPLGKARDQGLPYWFVAAYGVSRHLRFSSGPPAQPPSGTTLHRERMRSLFDPDAHLLAIGFADLFDATRARLFARFVQALTRNVEDLLPELADIELTGKGGVTRPEDLLNRHRIVQTLPGGARYKLPATWLSHGYQSSLSWLSDLLGHALIEDPAFDDARGEKAKPEELQGLVLIDELDLHLHPSWQRTFVQALAKTFPKLQFVATTHSPLLVSALRPDEVVALELDESDHVVQRALAVDPRLLTGSELNEELFGTHGIHAQDLGRWLNDYRFWARNPNRDGEKQAYVIELKKKLTQAGIELPFEPVARRARTGRR